MMRPKHKPVKMDPKHFAWEDFSKKITSLCPNCFACPHRQRSKQCSDRHARAALKSFDVDVAASLDAFQKHGVGGCDCRIAQKRSWVKPPVGRRRMIRRKSNLQQVKGS
jgi:hypothetical protein